MLCPLRLDIDEIDIDGSPWLIDETFVKTHARVDFADEDDNLQSYIKAAVLWAENANHRTVIRREHRWVLREFPVGGRQEIRLPRGKTQRVLKIEYSVGGTLSTLYGPSSVAPGTDYQEDLRGNSGAVLMPPRGSSWPSVDEDVPAPVIVTFDAGWAVEDIPSDLMDGILMAIADAYDLRGSADVSFAKLNDSGTRLPAREVLISSYMLPREY